MRFFGSRYGYLFAAVAAFAFAGYSGQIDVGRFPPNQFLAAASGLATVGFLLITWANGDPVRRWTPPAMRLNGWLSAAGAVLTVYLAASLRGILPTGLPEPAFGIRNDNLGIAAAVGAVVLVIKARNAFNAAGAR